MTAKVEIRLQPPWHRRRKVVEARLAPTLSGFKAVPVEWIDTGLIFRASPGFRSRGEVRWPRHLPGRETEGKPGRIFTGVDQPRGRREVSFPPEIEVPC
jgi:hypothetical protein